MKPASAVSSLVTTAVIPARKKGLNIDKVAFSSSVTGLRKRWLLSGTKIAGAARAIP